MKKYLIMIVLIFGVSRIVCAEQIEPIEEHKAEILFPDRDFFKGYPPMNEDGTVNAVIEIPAGTNEKWEVKTEHGHLELDTENGKPRTVKYLGYPGNYGMVPRTILAKEDGGDGDPLDILVIGAPLLLGSVNPVKLIGVIRLTDRGEKDDKLICVVPGSALDKVNSIEELDKEFPGIISIVETWFLNYKGTGMITSQGYGTLEEAQTLLYKTIDSYRKQAGRKE